MGKTLRAGRIVSAVAVLFLVLDGVSHLMKPAPVAEAFHRLARIFLEPQCRVLDPLFDTTFPIIVGALVWGGLYLMDPRLRAYGRAAPGTSPDRAVPILAIACSPWWTVYKQLLDPGSGFKLST